MGDDASSRSLNGQDAQLRATVQELAARVAEMERQARIEEILSGSPGPRHARKRERPDWLRVIPGGLAAMAPAALAFHDGLPAAGLTACRWLWRAQRDHARWAVAALLLAAVGVSVPVAASDGRAPHHAPALSCRAPRPYHPDDRDGDSDDRTVVALLPPACAAAGEGRAGHVARLPWPAMARRG